MEFGSGTVTLVNSFHPCGPQFLVFEVGRHEKRAELGHDCLGILPHSTPSF